MKIVNLARQGMKSIKKNKTILFSFIFFFFGCSLTTPEDYGCIVKPGGWCCREQVPLEVVERWRKETPCANEEEAKP